MTKSLATSLALVAVAALGFIATRAHGEGSCGSDSDCAGYGRCSGGKCSNAQ